MRIRYAISRDGVTWQDMGEAFPQEDAFGSRQWAGSSYYDPATQQIWLYYTATGQKGEQTNVPNGSGGSGGGPAGNGISYDQRIALALGRLTSAINTVQFEGWRQQIVLETDNSIYERATGVDPSGTVYAFRDPFIFKDPANGKTYMTFTARPSGAGTYAGAVGMAEATNGNFTQFRLLRPIITSNINNELERPNFVYYQNKYYPYFSTHIEKFTPELQAIGPEGLYGFVADRLGGPYRPLNGSALVAANPPTDPYAYYSWLVLNNNSVLSNVNYFNVGGLRVGEFGAQGEAWDREHWGGRLAPRFMLNVSGDQATLGSSLGANFPQ